MTADLHWFAFFAADWLSSPTIAAMLPEQEGAYVRLLATAWGNGVAEPSLPADSRALASMSRLGPKWKKLGPAIRAQFELRDGKLYNAKLSEVWRDGQQRHADAVKRGKAGADKRWKKRGQSIGALMDQPIDGPIVQPIDGPMLEQCRTESEETLLPPTEVSSSFPPEALGVETPRPAELPVDRDVRTGKAEQPGGIVEKFMARFGQRPAVAT